MTSQNYIKTPFITAAEMSAATLL